VKLLYVVQRYGEDIVGGSEAACRQFAEHLTTIGHDVTVLTSCAKSYVTWEDVYEPGESSLNGVKIQRLPVIGPRTPETFGPMDQWLMSGKGAPSMWEHERWARLMGPNMRGLREWLITHAHKFDVAVFMTYLYTSTTLGLPAIAGRIPTVFQPTAHKEPPLKVGIFDATFRLPDAFLFFTPEEKEVVRARFLLEPEGEVIGIGIDDPQEIQTPQEFRQQYGLKSENYLIYVGRLDPMKGVQQLCDFFVAFKSRNNDDLKLVLAGEAVTDLPSHPDIIVTGFLDEPMKHAAIKGSLALVQSSYFESFSIVLCEAWVQARPALVQGASPVLRGQAMRSGGAIAYEGFAEFEQAVQMLAENPDLATSMGLAGQKYVEQNYKWPVVLDGFERTLKLAQQRFEQRSIKLTIRN
jgi:glycosyltransferase involved in cell wall biosynthesis